ncbi:MAG: transglycosylase SLT domain-containing protein [Boseongicola sp.]
MRAILLTLPFLAFAFGSSAAEVTPEPGTSSAPITVDATPPIRGSVLPRARWEHRRGGALWSRVSLSAIQTHGRTLLDVVPRDIAAWCPAYAANDADQRAAFWAALLSTLSRYESTWDPRAVGGGGRWFGLLQIYPQTAEFRRCDVQTGNGLKQASANLNCAVRIMSVTVPRDQAISLKENRWKGVAADWGPIRNDWMRRDMQRYTSRQIYCRSLAQVRPKARPACTATCQE